jgi:hypothetical protein
MLELAAMLAAIEQHTALAALVGRAENLEYDSPYEGR